MHHPFVVLDDDPDVRALRHLPDGYLAALREFDRQFEQFLMTLHARGLMRNTVLVVLGDHGRHESVGDGNERELGHFRAAMFIWLDETLRRHQPYLPRPVR